MSLTARTTADAVSPYGSRRSGSASSICASGRRRNSGAIYVSIARVRGWDMHRRVPPIPYGIFLDTSVVAYLETHAAAIFERGPIDGALPAQLQKQIHALRILMALADRAGLAFAVSPG